MSPISYDCVDKLILNALRQFYKPNKTPIQSLPCLKTYMVLRELHNKIPWDMVEEKRLSSYSLYYVHLYTPGPKKKLFNDTNEKKKKHSEKQTFPIKI